MRDQVAPPERRQREPTSLRTKERQGVILRLPESALGTLPTIDLAAQDRRFRRGLLWRILIAAVVGAGALVGAVQGTHLLLRDVHWHTSAQPTNVAPAPLGPATVPTIPPGVAPAGLGATQSVAGVTLTLTAPATALAPADSSIFGAPDGMKLLQLSVRLINTVPDQAMVFTAFDFWIDDGSHQLRHQDMAPLAHPLSSGLLPPHHAVTGDLAFWIPTSTTFDARIYYFPQQVAGISPSQIQTTQTIAALALVWVVPTAG